MAGIPVPAGARIRQRRHRNVTAINAMWETMDAAREQALKECRVDFTYEKWAKHRSTSRYARHVLTIPVSNVVRGLVVPLVTVGSIATALCTYEYAHLEGWLPDYCPSFIFDNTFAFGVASFALSMLMVFRTNASYGRFDEARKLWGGMVNRSRDITRQACTWFQEDERVLLEALVRWQAAFPWVVKNHLRKDQSWEDDLKDILLPEELDMLLSYPGPDRANVVLVTLAEVVERAHVSSEERLRIDQNLTYFADMLGACERILRTPIPLSYTRLTSRLLVLWMFGLPFTIYSTFGWLTIPASIMLTYVLLAIKEIGVLIEEPFMILPLESFSATSASDVTQHLVQLSSVRAMVSQHTLLLPPPALTANNVVNWRQVDAGTRNGAVDRRAVVAESQ